MIQNALLISRLEFLELADAAIGSSEMLDYVRRHKVDLGAIGWFAGALAVLPIARLPGQRFVFDARGGMAFICEAYGVDGESVIDLVAWFLDEPETPLSMFGRCGLLGIWQAMAPGTYIIDGILRLHRTPIKWLQAGCDGAAVVDPHIAGRQLVEVPGRIAAEDHRHGREIVRLLRTAAAIDNKVIAPATNPRAA